MECVISMVMLSTPTCTVGDKTDGVFTAQCVVLEHVPLLTCLSVFLAVVRML